jgi:hypothetical protein
MTSVAVLDAYLAALRVRTGLPIAPCVACPGFARGGAALCADCLRAVDTAHDPHGRRGEHDQRGEACGCEPCARAERVVRALVDAAARGETR